LRLPLNFGYILSQGPVFKSHRSLRMPPCTSYSISAYWQAPSAVNRTTK
jgi:hypothetical protein